MSSGPSRVIGLFATPLLHAAGVLQANEIALLRDRFALEARQVNSASKELSHTRIIDPGSDSQLRLLCERVQAHLTEFGELLFGEALQWTVKELWFNVLAPGGQQMLHNHANSFVSGVIYLTPLQPGACTVFVRGMGHAGYVFSNTHGGSRMTPFNSDKWVMPVVDPGDLILFPSHLLHEVPVNRGDQRITLAFNAIPHRLDSWGYQVGFSA